MQIDSSNQHALILRGIVHCMQDENKQSLEDFNKVNCLNCISTEYFYYKAICLMNLKDFEEALKTINLGLNRSPNHFDLLKERAYLITFKYNNSNILKFKGNHEEAIKEYTNILKEKIKEEEIIECMMNRAFCLGKIGDFQNAISDYTQILCRTPLNNHCLFNRGICYQKKNEFNNVIKNILF